MVKNSSGVGQIIKTLFWNRVCNLSEVCCGMVHGNFLAMCFWLFPTVHFQISPQIACHAQSHWLLWHGSGHFSFSKSALHKLAMCFWLFSTVHFRTSPQIACLRGCTTGFCGMLLGLFPIKSCTSSQCIFWLMMISWSLHSWTLFKVTSASWSG